MIVLSTFGTPYNDFLTNQGRQMRGGGGGFNPLQMATPNPWVQGGFALGGNLLKAFGLGGESWEEKQAREMVSWLKSQRDIPAISRADINRASTGAYMNALPQINKAATAASSRVGLDSGAALGEIARMSKEDIGRFVQYLERMAMQMNAQKPMQIASAMGGYL